MNTFENQPQKLTGSRKRRPKVSVGLPVYNGELYLRESIESVLAQNFEDFELLISDNASTDSTWEICKEFARTDSRVRVHRQQRNIGSRLNFAHVFEHTTGPFFMWHAHDDFRSPNTLSTCVGFLDENAEYVLCSTQNTRIDDSAKPLYSLVAALQWDSSNPVDRLRACVSMPDICHAIYGLIRRDSLLPLVPGPALAHATDDLMVALLSLSGKGAQRTEAVRYFRSTTSYVSARAFVTHYPRLVLGEGFRRIYWQNLRYRRNLLKSIVNLRGLTPTERVEAAQIVRQAENAIDCTMRDVVHAVQIILSHNQRLYQVAKTLECSLQIRRRLARVRKFERWSRLN